jgi:hypothetical protein
MSYQECKIDETFVELVRGYKRDDLHIYTKSLHLVIPAHLLPSSILSDAYQRSLDKQLEHDPDVIAYRERKKRLHEKPVPLD